MASTYSTNLALELIGTGDQAGTWGVTTNTNLGTLLEQAISGYVTQAVSTGTDTTITIPNGSTGVARNMYIELTGTGGTNTNLIVPANKKLYFIFNNASGAVTVKVSGQTGVSVPAGKKMILVSNGTDIVNGVNYIADFGTNSFTVTNLTATSATITNLIATTATVSDLSATVLRAASASITNLALTSLTISSLSITNVSVASATVSSNLTLSGGTANGVLYLNGSKVATSGTGFVFTGTNAGIGTSSPNKTGFDSNARVLTIYGPNRGMLELGSDAPINSDTLGGVEFLSSTTNKGYIRCVLDGSANGQLSFAINNTEGFRLTSTSLYTASGINVGIGTSSPSSKLDLVGILQWQATAGTVLGKLTYAGGEPTVLANTGLGLNFYTNNAFAAKIDSSGNLGLGVTPSAWPGQAANYDVLQFGTGAVYNVADNATEIAYNQYIDSAGTRRYITTNTSHRYRLGNTEHSWYVAASGTAGNTISFTQAMTLDASGNLVVGGTSADARFTAIGSSASSIVTVATLQNPVNAAGTGHGARLILHSTADTGRGVAIASSSSANYATDNAMLFYTSASSTLTERARITSDGKLLVNATATATVLNKTIELSSAGTSIDQPAYIINSYVAAGNAVNCGYFQFQRSAGSTVGTNTLVANDDRLGMVRFNGANGTSYNAAAEIYAEIDGTPGASNDMPGRLIFATTANGNASTTERARITSGGYFKVQANTSYQNAAGSYNEFANATANEYVCWFRNAHSTNPFGVYIYYPNTSPNGTSSNFLTAIDSTALRAELRSNGGLANYQANNVDLSDARTKKDITPAASMWGKVAALEIVAYKYNDQTHDDVNLGVIAQQVEAVEPVWVDNDGWGDETPEDGVPLKTVYTKDITFAAIKALQEAMARIEQLEADMAALKASA